jgi:glycosidase
VRPNAGFTTGTPWLPIPESAKLANVEVEKSNANSIFAWYQRLIRLKKVNPAFAQGDNIMLDTGNTHVLSWERKAPGQPAVVISVNFTAESQTVNLSGGGLGSKVRTLLKTPGGADPASLESISLGAFGVFIGQVE